MTFNDRKTEYLNMLSDFSQTLPISWVELSDYFVIMKVQPDIIMGNEPYWASSVILHIPTGYFTHRTFGQVQNSGQFHEDTLLKYFKKIKICQGIQHFKSEDGLKMLQNTKTLRIPYTRIVSKNCATYFSVENNRESCENCSNVESTSAILPSP